MPAQPPPPLVLPNLPIWAANFKRVATQPLVFCESFPEISRRHESWWRNEPLELPLVLAQANPRPERPIDRRLELLADPDAWFAARVADIAQWHRSPDMLPSSRVDFGAVALGALLGAPIQFGSDTSWTSAVVSDDWSNEPEWRVYDDNAWWRLMRVLMTRVAADAPGRYLIRFPSLGGSADVLLNMRGATPLCLDVMERPQRIVAALAGISACWQHVYSALNDIICAHGAGLVAWTELWSDAPYVVPECDFNYLIGPRDFAAYFLPDVVRVAASVGRALFHLDGPWAARHADALIAQPAITAIQFVEGAQTAAGSLAPFVPMLRKIQAAGKPLQLVCEAHHALEMVDELDPRRLCFLITSSMTPAVLDAWQAELARRCRTGRRAYTIP